MSYSKIELKPQCPRGLSSKLFWGTVSGYYSPVPCPYAVIFTMQNQYTLQLLLQSCVLQLALARLWNLAMKTSWCKQKSHIWKKPHAWISEKLCSLGKPQQYHTNRFCIISFYQLISKHLNLDQCNYPHFISGDKSSEVRDKGYSESNSKHGTFKFQSNAVALKPINKNICSISSNSSGTFK